MRVLPPGSVIGILGGGQLGRMTALAAARLGYPCHIFCSGDDEPALEVCAFRTIAPFDDEEALSAFAKAVDVVTLEWENVPLRALEVVSRYAPVHPSARVLATAQDREKEKTFARSIGVGTADFAIVHSADELARTLSSFTLPVILKSTRMGYDGKGQVKITPGMDPAQAWADMGSDTGIIEAFVDFECEVSVIVAVREDGANAPFPVVRNVHKNQILAETHAPSGLSPEVEAEAQQVAVDMARQLGVIGLLAVELFVLRQPDAKGRRVLMNEIAPRPHNSGHWTMDACPVSQFEQLVRAVCGLPLGDVTPHSRAVMLNLIGDDYHRWQEYLAEPNACLHLYGKKHVREGRKMGHINLLKGGWRT